MKVSFSNCVKKVSYADPSISVPVKLNPKRYPDGSEKQIKTLKRLKLLEEIDVFERFDSIVIENIKRVKRTVQHYGDFNEGRLISHDARLLTNKNNEREKLKPHSLQLIITSPPYAGAQKYIRASSLSLGWTELANINELNQLDRNNIGRENYRRSELKIKQTQIKAADKLIKSVYKINPVRAVIICNYLHEMMDALKEMKRVLKRNGYLVLIVGNNKVCNQEFNVQQYFCEYLTRLGLHLQIKLIDHIKSYGLMTKRNKTADIISREWILVFKK